MRFDESDSLPDFIDDTLRERETSDVLRTRVPLLIGGRSVVHHQSTSAFVGDVRRSVESAAEKNLDARRSLHAARRLLCDDRNWRALVCLSKYLVSVDEKHSTVAQLLSHPHRRKLVDYLDRQPERPVVLVDPPIDVIRSLVSLENCDAVTAHG